jgi:hypothetical protein
MRLQEKEVKNKTRGNIETPNGVSHIPAPQTTTRLFSYRF